VALSDIGVIVGEEWLRTAEVRDDIVLDEFVLDEFVPSRQHLATKLSRFNPAQQPAFRHVQAYIKANPSTAWGRVARSARRGIA
jgi:hypothetical protein